MPKTVGLSQTSSKMLEVSPFPKDVPGAALLCTQAISFFKIFQNYFGNGCQLVLEKHYVPIDCLGGVLRTITLQLS